MVAWRRAIELSLEDADSAKLRSIAQSRTEPASRVERARILLAYREDPSFFAAGRRLGRAQHQVSGSPVVDLVRSRNLLPQRSSPSMAK